MGLLDELFSGRSSDIYGEGLLTREQRGGLGNIGLLALAGKLGQLAGPSFSPVPDFGAALGQAAGAYGASQEGAGKSALEAILTAQKGRKLKQELDYYEKLGPVLGKLAGDWPGAGGGEGSGSTGGGAVAPAGAGGGGGAGGGAGGGGGTYWTPAGLAALQPTEGRYDQIHYPTGYTKDGVKSSASGAFGFIDSTWRQYASAAGVDINKWPRAYMAPPEIQDRVAAITPISHWTGVDANGKPFNANAQKLATNPAYVAGGAPTAAASDSVRVPYNYGAPGGGLLAVPAPNPLSDAEPIVGIPRPAVAPQAAAGAPMTGEEARRRQAASDAEIKSFYPGGSNYVPPVATPGQGASAAETPGFAGRQLVAQLGAGSPLAALSQYAQVAGPGAADAAAPPRAPLPTMGPTGIELPPMQGPLAAPAPAAAAPAAPPGPGLIAAPGATAAPAMPAAAALPRGANPAFDIYLRNLALAGTLAEGAGLKNVFAPLTEALKASPAYQAELERAKARVGVEFAGPRTTAEKTAAEPFAIAASQRELENKLTEAGWRIENGQAIPIPKYNDVAEAKANAVALGQAGPKLDADLAAQGVQRLFDANGNLVIAPITGAAEAAARAARLKAEATPTPEAQNYDDYVKDAQMRKQPVLSRIDWERTKGQPDPERAGRIALDLKAAEPLAAQAAAGREARPLLDEVVRIAYQTPEGMAGEGGAAVGKAMSAFGFSPTARMSNAELLSAMQQRLIGPIQLSGTTSDRDVSRYLAATPGLMSTGDGRVKMAEMTKALIDRNIELAEVYRSNLGALDLSQKLAAVHNKPLFTDEQRAAIDETIRTRGGTAPEGPRSPVTSTAPAAPAGSIVTPYGTLTPVR